MPTVEISEEKRKALSVAIAQIERAHGKGSIMRMGADGARVVVEAISTGAMNLDAAIGIGGIPRGRITEIFGPESSGKTTLCLHVIANAQKKGGVAAFIDAEHALDIEYARKLGVDVDNPGQPAGHGGAGARDRRHADPEQCGGRGRGRLGGRTGATGGDRG